MYGRNLTCWLCIIHIPQLCLVEGKFAAEPRTGTFVIHDHNLSVPVGSFKLGEVFKAKVASPIPVAAQATILPLVPTPQPAATPSPSDTGVLAWIRAADAKPRNGKFDDTGLHTTTIKEPGDQCGICLDTMHTGGIATTVDACGHFFHERCMGELIRAGVKRTCPVCRAPFGVVMGDQPDGVMQYTRLPAGRLPLSGNEADGTILIRYTIPQGQTHNGTVRNALLPDTQEGREVLDLLCKAWHHRLIFTVGPSLTTGEIDAVTWASIPHKTRSAGGAPNHGYPDPTYFTRVKEAIRDAGIVN